MNRGYSVLVCVLAAIVSGCSSGNGKSSRTSSNSPSAGVFADRVIQYVPINSQAADSAQWPYFFQPNATLGTPGGMLDVGSLGYDPAASSTLGGSIVLGLGDGGGHRCIVNDADDDFVIYENAFRTTDVDGNPGTNNELAVVEVSADNSTWYAFPHIIDPGNPNLIDPARYAGFAGVLPGSEGGDRFDLASVISAYSLPAGFQACYVRLTDGGTLYPDYGNTQTDLYASGADIDAIEALHSVAMPGPSP